jgi:hypothetical protein
VTSWDETRTALTLQLSTFLQMVLLPDSLTSVCIQDDHVTSVATLSVCFKFLENSFMHFSPGRARDRSLRHVSARRKVTRSILDEITSFFNCANLCSCTVALGSTQPLTEMSIRNLPEVNGRPVRKADNLTVISEPIVLKIREPRCLITLRASTACYKDSFTVLTFLLFTSESEAVVTWSDVFFPLQPVRYEGSYLFMLEFMIGCNCSSCDRNSDLTHANKSVECFHLDVTPCSLLEIFPRL